MLKGLLSVVRDISQNSDQTVKNWAVLILPISHLKNVENIIQFTFSVILFVTSRPPHGFLYENGLWTFKLAVCHLSGWLTYCEGGEHLYSGETPPSRVQFLTTTYAVEQLIHVKATASSFKSNIVHRCANKGGEEDD